MIECGSVQLWTIIIVIVTAAIVLMGQYKNIDKIASNLAVALSITVLAAAVSVFPKPGELTAGLVPQFPADFKYG